MIKKHYYFPDFVIDKNIFEIKSKYYLKYNSDEIYAKKNAAEKYIENNNFNDYYLLFENELNEIGNLNYRYHLLSFCIDNNVVKMYSIHKKELYGKIHCNKKYYNEALGVYNKWNSLK